MKGQMAMLALVVAIVGGVVGLVIVDTVVTSVSSVTSVSNETATLTAVPSTITAAHYPIHSGSLTIKNATGGYTLNSSDYTVSNYRTGTISIVSYANSTYGNGLELYYNYEPAAFLTSSLSRVIVSYLVPMGLLGILALVAFAML